MNNAPHLGRVRSGTELPLMATTGPTGVAADSPAFGPKADAKCPLFDRKSRLNDARLRSESRHSQRRFSLPSRKALPAPLRPEVRRWEVSRPSPSPRPGHARHFCNNCKFGRGHLVDLTTPCPPRCNPLDESRSTSMGRLGRLVGMAESFACGKPENIEGRRVLRHIEIRRFSNLWGWRVKSTGETRSILS